MLSRNDFRSTTSGQACSGNTSVNGRISASSLRCARTTTPCPTPSAYLPSDKGAVENGVGVLKRGLRGREFETYDQLRAAVTALVCELNARPNSMTGKRPDDLIALERRGPLPERYPLAFWSESRVRSDCHVQVRSNFYSVPYQLVGKTVVARLDAT